MILPISVAQRIELILEEPRKCQPNRNIETDKEINENKSGQNLNKQSKNSKTEIRDDKCFQLKFDTPSRRLQSIHQRSLVSIIQENDNLPFGNIINNYDASSTRIIFTNTNRLFCFKYGYRHSLS